MQQKLNNMERIINLKLTGVNPKIRPIISVDGKTKRLKKNKFGSYEFKNKVKKDSVVISIHRNLELRSRFWWFYAILSFIISGFGILEPGYDRKCVDVNCKFIVKLKSDATINIKFNSFVSSGKAVEITSSSCSIIQEENSYLVDKSIKKKWIALLIIKIFMWLFLIGLIIYFIYNNINK